MKDLPKHPIVSVVAPSLKLLDDMKGTEEALNSFYVPYEISMVELKIPANDDSIIQTLQNSPYAAIFTEGNTDDNSSTIILANGITIDELNKEKSKTIDKVVDKK